MDENRYTDNGTVFYKPEDNSWCVQINFQSGYGGAPFKTIKWATWDNSHFIAGLQETNESLNMYGWRKATLADIALYCNSEISKKISLIQQLRNYGFTGEHSTNSDIRHKLRKLYG